MTDAQFPAGWYDDPMERFNQRYYDGSAWTDRVADDGVERSDPLDPAESDEGFRADQTVVIDRSALRSTIAAGTQPPTPSATPAASPGSVSGGDTGGAGDTKSLTGFLDSLGTVARRREAPELPLALGGLGGGLVGIGLIALIAQSGSRGAILGAAAVVLVLAFAAALKLLGDQPWLRTAATACCSVGLFALAAGFIGPDSISDNAPGTFFLIAGLLHLGAWVAPGFKGRPLMLGGGLFASALGIALLVAGGGCGNDPFTFEECNFAEQAASQVGLSTGAGITLLVLGAALLFGVRKLDSLDYRGTAETVAAAAIVVLIFGAIALSVDLGSTGNSLVVIAVGLGLGVVGHMAARRALTWTGAALVAGGVISLITNIVSTDDTTAGALIIIAIGAALVGVPRFIQIQAANRPSS